MLSKSGTALITASFSFFVLYCYHPWNSSLVPKLLFVFPDVFFSSPYADTRTILSASVLTSFQKWNMACCLNRIRNEKESLASHDTPSAAREGRSL